MNFLSHSTLYKRILFLLVVGIVVYFVGTFIAEQRLSDLETITRVQVATQESLLATIAETTARNGADSVTEGIIKDCPLDERSRFNALLDSLDQGLSQTQLIELEELFGTCGGFFAQRKAVMVARLSREIEIYEDYLVQLGAITGENEAENHQLTQWQQLAEGEQSQSVFFSELVRLQKAIIDELLAGNTASSDEIVSILSEVQETREALLLANTQTGTLRTSLTSL